MMADANTHISMRLLRSRAVQAVFKLAVTLAMIAAVGWVIVLGTDSQVADSQADIVDFGFAPQSDSARFVDALDRLGHGEPRRYELNGNTMYFSTNTVDALPREVLGRYQREFVAAGLNQMAYDRLEKTQTMQRTRDGFQGGVVPVLIADDHVIMNGVSTDDRARGVADLLASFGRVVERDGESPMASAFDAFRAVEIFREPGSKSATVIATWSADFDYDAMLAAAKGDSDVELDRRIPQCVRCEIVNAFSDQEAGGLHRSYALTTPLAPEQIVSFYRHKMDARGWQPAENADFLGRVQGQVGRDVLPMDSLHFVRDELSLEVLIYPIERRLTGVHITLTDGQGPAAAMRLPDTTHE